MTVPAACLPSDLVPFLCLPSRPLPILVQPAYQPAQTEQGNSKPLHLTLGDGHTGFGPGTRALPVSPWFYSYVTSGSSKARCIKL